MLDNANLRELIRRWRATPESTVALFGEAADAIRATAATKERVLYPAVREADPGRAGLIDSVIAQNRRIEGFLDLAERLGPNGPGFQDEAQEAAAATDGLLVHERRDILPALEGLSPEERERLDDRYRTAWVEVSAKLAAHRAALGRDGGAGAPGAADATH